MVGCWDKNEHPCTPLVAGCCESNLDAKQSPVFCRQSLEARHEEPAIRQQPAPTVWLLLTIATSKLEGAGTSAGVTVQLSGSNGSTTTMKLPAQPGDFGAGAQASFRVSLPSVGHLERLTVGHDSDGPQPHWHLDWVQVLEEATGTACLYACVGNK